MSLTTFIGKSNVVDDSTLLNNWRGKALEELGSNSKVDEFVDMTASFGTILHVCVGNFCKSGIVNWLELEFEIYDMLKAKGFSGDVLMRAQRELIRDFACIVEFFHQYKVEVLAVEIPVFYKKIATCIDIVAYMNAIPNKEIGDCDRDRCLINLKSGKKGTFSSHQMQLLGELKCFNETFKMPFGGAIKKVYNLCPTDWQTEPSFKLYDHSDKIIELEAEFNNRYQRLEISGIFDKMDNCVFSKFVGETKFGQSSINNIFKSSLMDYFKEK
jgi:hypothetical protein